MLPVSLSCVIVFTTSSLDVCLWYAFTWSDDLWATLTIKFGLRVRIA